MTEPIYATGKRKTSIARVWLKPGEGKFLVNEREIKEYFGRETCEMVVLQPFDLTGTQNQFDVNVNVQGGGISGQSVAIRHGISKALLQYNPEFQRCPEKGRFFNTGFEGQRAEKIREKGSQTQTSILETIIP